MSFIPSKLTNWVTYTPVFTGGTPPTNLGTGSTFKGQWRRSGDSMDVQVIWTIGSGSLTLGSGNWTFESPVTSLSLTIDTSKHLVGTTGGLLEVNMMAGSGFVFDATVSNRRSLAVFVDASDGDVKCFVNAGATVSATFPPWAEDDFFSVNYTIPILEWAR